MNLNGGKDQERGRAGDQTMLDHSSQRQQMERAETTKGCCLDCGILTTLRMFAQNVCAISLRSFVLAIDRGREVERCQENDPLSLSASVKTRLSSNTLTVFLDFKLYQSIVSNLIK